MPAEEWSDLSTPDNCQMMDVEYWISTLVFTPVNLMSLVVLVTASLVHLLLRLGQPEMVQSSFHYKESALARHLLTTLLDGGTSRGLRFPMQMWCTSPHLQSLLWPFLSSQAPVLFHREMLSLNDRGLVSLDWATSSQCCVSAHSQQTYT